MPARISPTVRRRLLSLELQRLRDEAGLTVAQAAKQAGWNASGLVRAENNKWRLPEVEIVARLLDAYGVPETRRSELLRLARGSRERGWWFAFREIGDAYATYIGLETGAVQIRDYETQVVPGLLQTEAYARALIVGRGRIPAEHIDALVDVRMQRQRELLTDTTDPVELQVILEEAALHRLIGGPAVMREQLEHLLKVAERPHVRLLVIPNEFGAAMAAGPFSILTFPDGYGPEAGCLETAAGPVFMEDGDALNRLRYAFESMIYDGRLEYADTLRVIGRRMAELPH